MFQIDSQLFPGSSGGLVISKPVNIAVIDGELKYNQSKQFVFLGVYSGEFTWDEEVEGFTADDFKKCYVPASGLPYEGAIVCWGGGPTNHIAYVKEVKDNNTIVILQAGWGTPDWTTPLYNADGTLRGYQCNERTIHRNYNGSGQYKKAKNDIWWFNNNGWNLADDSKCQGFFNNPAIQIPTRVVPYIIEVAQPTSGKVQISGCRGDRSDPTTFTRIYYKWDGTVSATDYTNYVETADFEFSISIDKQKKAQTLSVLPVSFMAVETWSSGAVTTTNLKSATPCIKLGVNTNGVVTLKNTVPYVYKDNKWNKTIPTIRDSDSWYHIFDDSKEKVT
jgi:hypothetical protein